MESNVRIVRILNRFGTEVDFYDNGSGPLWVLRDSMGIVGVVRADTWEDAYEIAEDELFPEADLSWEDIARECECDPEVLMDNAIFQEGYGFRPNGRNSTDKLGHGIYSRDLNGECLDKLTYGLAKDLGLDVQSEEIQ